MSILNKPTYVFIDAANIIYGTVTKEGDSWKIDYQRLIDYLKQRYGMKKVFYFGGIDKSNPKQKRFYQHLKKFGYITVLKPVKYYAQDNGHVAKKANCDVDMTFYMMKTLEQYGKAIVFSGDGDFLLVLKYLMDKKREVMVIANGQRTAKEIKQLVKHQFTDLNTLKGKVEYKEKGRILR